MKKLFILILTCIGLSANGQNITLSPTAEISIITCGPGLDEVYEAFGHTAIRVYDSIQGIDFAYNYGMFDFNQPNFYINYTKGLLYFKLGVLHYPDFRDAYIYYNRSVTEQVLNLSGRQTQALFEYLQWNALPENQTYRYDYFYNNCSSKVRDVMAQVLGDSLKFDDSFIKTDYTIRQLTDLYLTKQEWGDLGIDICLGLPMDKKAAPYEYMFLPDYLMYFFDHASIINDNGSVPAVKAKRNVYVTVPIEESKSLVDPWMAFGGFLAITLALSAYDFLMKKISKWFDVILFVTTGLIGTLLIILWTMTDHAAAARNMNILWALPTHLVVVIIYRNKSTAFLKKYFAGVSYLLGLMLLGWLFLPQQLNLFLIPFVMAMMCRAIVLSRLLQPTA